MRIGLALLTLIAITPAVARRKPPAAPPAIATLVSATGVAIGRATVTETRQGLRVTADVHGLAPGLHGIHIHSVGRCDGPDFASAGGHWNPSGRHHGLGNPAGPHMGDLSNLVVGADGRGTVAALIPGATVAGLLDADGAAMVIHAAPDDGMSDPSGGSGARIACGTLAQG
jgi:superoxide dismutase, Cu-Zn family